MERSELYDPYGEGCSEAAWQKLPVVFQLFVQRQQMRIQKAIESKYPGKFVASSGFRSFHGNTLVGGKSGSRHCFGCARDFVSVGGGHGDIKPCLGDEFRVIRSPDCWHVEVI